MKSAVFYATKTYTVLRKQGLRGLLAAIASKVASSLVGAAGVLGGYTARYWKFSDEEPDLIGWIQSTAAGVPPRQPLKTWFDIGSHHGELTFSWARDNPDSIVYAFEPNIKAASKVIGKLPNFVVIPMAVSTRNGFETFYENAFEESSSLLPIDEEVRKMWVKGDELEVVNEYPVPSIRLDTFMEIMDITRVDFLKIDAQGYDYEVLVSCGERLRDIDHIQLEVTVTSKQFYRGARTKAEIVSFLCKRGFSLIEEQAQTYGM